MINVCILSFLLSITYLFFLKNTIDYNIKLYKQIIYVLFLSILLVIVELFVYDLYKIFIIFIIISVLNYFLIFERNKYKSIYYSFIIILLMVFLEQLFILLLKSGINSNIINFINKSIIIVVLLVLTYIKIINHKLRKFELNNKFVFFYIFIIILMIMILKIVNICPNNLIFIELFLIINYHIILYLTYYKNKFYNKYAKSLEELTNYEKIIDDQGKKNHEYNNQLMIISGYADDEKRLRDYLSTIIDDYKTGQNYEIRQLYHLPNGGLKGLMYYKLNKIKEYNIKYYINISEDFKSCFEKFDVYMYKDITRILGVFIDNAIDASKDTKEKEIEFDFKRDDKYIIMKISNSFKNDIKNVGKKGYTSKGKGHGYGLSLVRDIVKRNKKIESFSDVDNNIFTQTVLIDIR